MSEIEDPTEGIAEDDTNDNVEPTCEPASSEELDPRIIPFEKHKVTTMTLVIPLTGTINLDLAYALLPITPIELPPNYRRSQKSRLPHCSIPGSIISIRYKECTRGVQRSKNSNFFKNSITLDISAKDKNLSMKISRSNIHMCGASSETQAREGVSYILNYLLDIQDKLDNIKNKGDHITPTITWLKKATKGKFTPHSTRCTDGMRIISDYLVKTPTKPYPQDVDVEIADFILRQINDFTYHSDFCQDIDILLNASALITKPLAIDKVHKVMVNFKYNLGFKVDRFELAKAISGVNGFYAQYDNSMEYNVTITLPYKLPEEQKTLRKKIKYRVILLLCICQEL